MRRKRAFEHIVARLKHAIAALSVVAVLVSAIAVRFVYLLHGFQLWLRY